MNYKYKSLLKDTAIFAIGSIGSKLILFFMIPLYTNVLSAEEYGTAELVFTAAQLIMPFVSLVVFDAILRFGLMNGECKEDVIVCGFFVLVTGSIATVGLSPLVGLYQPLSQWKWYLCTYIIVYMATSIELSYLKAKGENRLYAALGIIQTLVLAMLNVVLLVVLKTGIQGYLIANIVANLIASVFAFVLGKIGYDLKVSRFKPSLLKQMLLYSSPLVINNISWWVIHSSDKVMLEAMIGASALGLYTVSSKIPSLINVLISIFSQAWGISSIKEMENNNDSSFYSGVFRTYSFIIFGACVVLITITRPFMAIYVGKNFVEAWQYVPLLLVSAVFAAVSSYFGSMYGALKKSTNNMWTTLIAALLNIILNYIFINICGIWGAVIGTLSAYIVMAIIRMLDVFRFVKLDFSKGRFVANCLLVIVQALLVSVNWHIYVVSGVAIVAFFLINLSTLHEFIEMKRKVKEYEEN